MPPQERPTAVTILAVLFVLNSVIVMAILGLLISGGLLAAGAAGLICMGPFILIIVFFLLVAYGLHGMRTWAWMVAMVFAILGLLGAIGFFASVGSVASGASIPGYFVAIPLFSLVINLVILVYLFQVRYHFS